MSIEAALLDAIGETPDDDLPRLVYADWLEEHAQTPPRLARAEFIRVQCELSRLQAGFARAANLAHQERVLRGAFLKAWVSELPRLPGVNWPCVFRRGFAWKVHLDTWKHYAVAAQTIFSSVPITYLRLLSLTPDECEQL